MYKATRNNGEAPAFFEDYAEACEWVADGSEYEMCENALGSEYVFPEGADDNNDCLGRVDEVEDEEEDEDEEEYTYEEYATE